MSKSQHKRICVQSDCAVRKELDNLLNEKDKTIQHLAEVIKSMIPLTVCDSELKAQWEKLAEERLKTRSV